MKIHVMQGPKKPPLIMHDKSTGETVLVTFDLGAPQLYATVLAHKDGSDMFLGTTRTITEEYHKKYLEPMAAGTQVTFTN